MIGANRLISEITNERSIDRTECSGATQFSITLYLIKPRPRGLIPVAAEGLRALLHSPDDEVIRRLADWPKTHSICFKHYPFFF